MTIDLILGAIGLSGLIGASYSDLKTKEVPDWISYGLLFSGVMLRLMHAAVMNVWSYILLAFPGFLSMGLVGYLLYKTKQWGGGDTKLLAAMGVVFATRPPYAAESNLPFLLTLIINILIVGALYGLVAALILAIKERKACIKTFKEVKQTKKIRFMQWTMLVGIILFGIYMNVYLPKDMPRRWLYNLTLIPLALLPYFMAAVKSVEKVCLYKRRAVDTLTEGDWVEEDVYKGKLCLYKKSAEGITKNEIEALKKAKVKQVLVKEGIAFTPTFLIATILTVVSGDLIPLF